MAPSRQTRTRDGILVPDIDTYNQAYIKNFKPSFSQVPKSLEPLHPEQNHLVSHKSIKIKYERGR